MMRVNREEAQCIVSVIDLVEGLASVDAVMVAKKKSGLMDLIISHEKPADGYSLAEMYSTFHTLCQYLTACNFDTVITDEEERVFFHAYGLTEVDINELIGPLRYHETNGLGEVFTASDRGKGK
ncbi:MAG: hypothetical protein ACON5J_19060 [Rubripirellula sp.]